MFCNKCGAQLEQGVKFCNKCGHQNEQPTQQAGMGQPIRQQPSNQQPHIENKGLNPFVWAGFVVDLIGFFIAITANFTMGMVIMLIGLVLSIIGLVICIDKQGDVKRAGLFVFLDIAFLIGLLVFRDWF